MKTDKLEVSIETTNGRPMRSYSHEGKTFVESYENSVYQIRVKNKTDRRMKAVISVDSLNIVNGKPASNDPAETGYIIGADEEQVFKGFRVDDDNVAAFTFVKREKSYATEKGEGQGNGVIAVRAYEEKETESEKALKTLKKRIKDLEDRPREKEYIPYRPWYWEDDYYRPYRPRPYFGDVWCGGYVKGSTTIGDNILGSCGTTTQFMCNASLTSSNAASLSSDGVQMRAMGMASEQKALSVDENPFSMGSGWGEAVRDSVKMVEFEVGKLIGEISIYYAAIEGLKVLGVNVDRVKSVAFPEPFKREWCPKPSGWKG